MAGSLGNVSVGLTLDASVFIAGMRAASSIMSAFKAETITPIGAIGTALTGLGLTAAAVGAVSTKMAADFQTGLVHLVTDAGESKSALQSVGQGILQIAVATGTSTTALTSAMYMVESAGYHGAAGLQVLKISAEGAKVGNADLATTARVLTTILHDYHLPATAAAGAMNGLTAAVASGKLHLQDLVGSMGNVLPLASALGISFPDVAAAIATMTNSGMSAQRASMNLANAIRALSAPSKTAQDAMHSVGLTSQQVKDELSEHGLAGAIKLVSDAVGKTFPAGSVQAVAAFKAIMGGATGYNVALMLGGKNMTYYQQAIEKISEAMKKGGVDVENWDMIQGTFNQKMDQAKAALQVLGITIGSALLPALTRILAQVAPLIIQFTQWMVTSGALKNAINLLVNVFTAIGTAISNTVQFFQKNQWAMNLLMAAAITLGAVLLVLALIQIAAVTIAIVGLIVEFAPLILVCLAVMAVIFLVITVIRNWGAITTWMSQQWARFVQAVKDRLGELGNDIHNVFTTIVTFLQGVWNNIVHAVTTAWNNVNTALTNGVNNAHNAIVNAFNAIKNFIVTTWNNIDNALTTGVNNARQAIINGFNNIKSWLQNLWNGVVNDVHNAVNAVVNAFQWMYNHNYYWKDMVDGIHMAVSGLSSWLQNIWKTISTNAVKNWNDLKTQTADAWNNVVNAVKTGTQNAMNAMNTFGNNLQNWYNKANNDTTNAFNKMRDSIRNSVSSWWSNSASPGLSSFSNNLSNWYNTANNNTTTAFNNMGNSIRSSVSSWWSNDVAGPLGALWNNFVNWYNTANTNTTTAFNDMGNRIRSAVSSWWASDVAGPLNSLGASIKGFFSNLAQALFQAGANLGNMVANGIRSAIGNISSAASSAAGAIAKFLGFHSPTELGPGSTADKWMPNFISMMSKGLTAGTPEIQTAMVRLVQPLTVMQNISGSRVAVGTSTGVLQNASRASQNSGGYSTANIVVQLDSRTLAQTLGQPLVDTIRVRTGIKR